MFPLFQTNGNRGPQFLRQDRRRLSLPALLAKIDNAHERHLLRIDALRQRGEFIFPGNRVVITLERRRRRPQNNNALLDLGPHDRDVARVIARRFLLFVSGFVFFIDNDQSKIFQRRENGTAGADDNAGVAGMDFVPFIVAFAFREMTMQNRNHILCFGETALEAFDRLRRQGNFRNEDDRAATAFERRSDSLKINFSFSATGYAVQQNRTRVFRRLERFHDFLQGQCLFCIQFEISRQDELLVAMRIARDGAFA